MEQQEAYSIEEFCRAHAISRGMFYKMVNAGQGPRLMTVGTHKRISREAAADWRRAREAESKKHSPHDFIDAQGKPIPVARSTDQRQDLTVEDEFTA